MTSLSLKLLTSSKMNKTTYHLKALIKIYRMVQFSSVLYFKFHYIQGINELLQTTKLHKLQNNATEN